MSEGAAQKKMRIGLSESSQTIVRIGNVIFNNIPLTRNDVSAAQIASSRIRQGGILYNVIKNGEIVPLTRDEIGENNKIEILFDYTDKFQTSKR